MAVDPESVRKVATLARLKLSEKELALYGEQLGAILDYVAKIESLDLEGVEPLAHAGDATNVMRDDVPRPCLPREEALKNAPQKSDEAFIVPKIIE